jgi:DNA-binding NarL/FixJ family response regulator
MYGEPLYPTQAMEAGAMGYILKGGDFDELIQAIHEASAGRRHISLPLSAEVLP